jgi:hypothetical protein
VNETFNPYQPPVATEGPDPRRRRSLLGLALAVPCILGALASLLHVVTGIVAIVHFKIDVPEMLTDFRGRTMLMATCGLLIGGAAFFDAARSFLKGRWRRAALGVGPAIFFVWCLGHL